MDLRSLKLVVFIASALMSGRASWADTTTTAVVAADSTSTATTSSFWDRVSDVATLNYFGVYRGASLSDFANSHQPKLDGTPDPLNPLSVESLVTAGYRVTPDITVGAIAHFNYFPVGLPAGTGQNLQMLDPTIYVQKKNMVDVDGLKVTGRLWFSFQETSADYLRPNHLAAYVSPIIITNYEVPHTSLTVGIYTYLKMYIPDAAAASNAPTYKFYVAPTANYQITQTVAATLWVDLIQATRSGGTPLITGMDNYQADIEPGISWDITKNITINPIINFYPGYPTLAATSIQAFIIAKAF